MLKLGASVSVGSAILRPGPVYNPADPRLRWAAPNQTAPTMITLGTGFFQATSTAWTNTSGNGRANGPRAFADDEDVIFTMPASARTGDFESNGGRNIRIIKGNSGAGRMTFKEVTASVFLEGISWSLAAKKDAINVLSKSGFAADVYLQHLAISGVRGVEADAAHSDMFQHQGNMGHLRVHRVTGDSNYQGFFIAAQFDIASATFSRVNLKYNAVTPAETFSYLLWTRDTDSVPGVTANGKRRYPVYYDEVYIEPRSGQTVALYGAWPKTGETIDGIPVGAIDDGLGNASWPAYSNIFGKVMTGLPSGGDFSVAGGTGPGTGYVSPGYQITL